MARSLRILFFELAQRGWDASAVRKLLHETLPEAKEILGFKLADERPDGMKRQVLMNARLVEQDDGGPAVTLLTFQDVTASAEKG